MHILIPVSSYLTLKMYVVCLIDENVHYQYRLTVALMSIISLSTLYIVVHRIKIFQCFISFDVIEYSRKLNGHSLTPVILHKLGVYINNNLYYEY